MENFKVRCIDASSMNFIHEGEVYTVTDTTPTYNSYYIEGVGWYNSSRFERIDSHEEANIVDDSAWEEEAFK
jgi:hypothetical protein